MFVVQVAGGVVLVVLVLAFFLWRRSSGPSKHVRPTLPPSPYQPSRGFKMLDGTESPAPHDVPRPRLDPHKEFVFGEYSPTAEVEVPHLRHDERWALDRSMRRVSPPRTRRRRRVISLSVVVVAAVVALLATHIL